MEFCVAGKGDAHSSVTGFEHMSPCPCLLCKRFSGAGRVLSIAFVRTVLLSVVVEILG